MRPDLPNAPPGIQVLPCDARGYPIPWFVHVEDDGTPDFRIIGYNKIGIAVRNNLCWLCGRKLRRMNAFVIGPMCAVNRVSSEPPSHPECAVFAAKACPFLTRPLAKRNERGLDPDKVHHAAGVPISRNPGVTLIWWTLKYTPFRAGDGVLFTIGAPERAQWFAYGRPATRDEVLDSISTGLPALEEMARAEGQAAISDLAERCFQTMQLLPAAA